MKRTVRTLLSLLRIAIAISLLSYLGFSGVIEWSSLGRLVAGWSVTLTAFILLLAAVVVTSWRLCVLLKPRGLYLSLFASVRLTLMATFFNTCLPGSSGGDVIRMYYASAGNQGRRTEVITIMLLDRTAGMFALIIWPLLVVPFFPQLLESLPVLRGLLWGAVAMAVIMVAGLLAVSASPVRDSRLASGAIQKLPLGSYAANVLNTVQAYRHHAGTLLAAVGISLLAHTLAIGVMLLLGQVINPTGFAWQMSILIPLGVLANTLPITPGGLGVGEAAFNQLFSMAGLSGGAEILLGWRLLTILISLLGLIFYLQGRRRFVHQSSSTQHIEGELSFL